MTDETIWRLKVHAFLHDPPEKALILFEGGHGARGRELAEQLVGPAPEGAEAAIREADHLASAADRETLLRGAPDLRWSNEPVLRHPLSGDEINLGQWGWIGVEPGAARSEVDWVVKQLKDALASGNGPTPERAFWALWRLSPEYLAESRQNGSHMGALWDYLPADTRMPDHSIWDHQRLVSALAPIIWQGQDPCLLLVSFGPVQGFIAAARRTADLWAGSFILSWLANWAIVPLVQAYGPDAVLFPVLWRQPLQDKWLQEAPLHLPVSGTAAVKREASLPNRFLAVIPKDKAGEIGEKCVAALRNAWRELGDRACQTFARLSAVAPETIAAIFERQIPSHLESYWAAFPWPNDLGRCQTLLQEQLGGFPSVTTVALDDIREYCPSAGALYGHVYRALDLTLGGVKASRFFESNEEPGRKCSLCGVRELVHPHDQSDLNGCKAWWRDLAERNPRYVRKGEALCAVCLVKRLGSDILKDEMTGFEGVPSTSEIAAAPFKLAVLENLSSLREPVQTLVEAARDNDLLNSSTLSKVWQSASKLSGRDGELAKAFARIDGECFWVGREAEDDAEEGRISPETAKAARELVRAAGSLKTPIPTPFQYLAILRMDGDDMGKWLGGDRTVKLGDTLHPKITEWLETICPKDRPLWQEPRRMTPATHAAISRACGAFSLKLVPALVHKRLAYLIYAGGDDMLALVSLDDALGLAREIRLAFGGHMERENGQPVTGFNQGRGFYLADGELIQTFGRLAGLSGSLVVFHHKYPLQAAVEESRRAEEWAKALPGKDCLALHIIRRSGQPTRCRLRWTNEAGSVDAVRDLSTISSAMSWHALSPRFVSAMKGLLDQPEAKVLLPEAVELLLKRELGRHWEKEQAAKIGLSEDDLRNAMLRLRSQFPCSEEWLAALEAAVFFARGGR
jgi:CRISPR-associated protein Cmr2